MILVTGGTGFLGAYIIKQLVQQDHRVRALRRNSNKLPAYIAPEIMSQVEWFEGDILDVVSLEEAMNDIDAVIHSAAKVSFSAADKNDMHLVNIEGTANVVNIALDKKIRRLVHISSVAALGRTSNGETIDEKQEWVDSPINTQYAISKHKAEMEVWRAMGEGLNAVILNPTTILGHGDWNTSSSALFKTVFDEFPFYTNGVNGFVYVEDVAEATIRLMESEITRERFIINGENWSFRKLFNTIADGFNKKHPQYNAGPVLAGIAWRWGILQSLYTGKKSLLSKESARIAQTETYFKNAKIIEALPGFSFTPLDNAILQSCALYLQDLSRS